MVAEQILLSLHLYLSCSLAKISMVAELDGGKDYSKASCSLAKISMVAEQYREK